MNNAKQQAGVRDWVDSTFYDSQVDREKPFERTHVLPRLQHDLLDGCSVKELDIELDTVPGELMELIERR